MTDTLTPSVGERNLEQGLLFEGYRVEKATLHVTAGVEIPERMIRELQLGSVARIRIEVGGEHIHLTAPVTKRTHALENDGDGGKVPVSRHVIVADPDSIEILPR